MFWAEEEGEAEGLTLAEGDTDGERDGLKETLGDTEGDKDGLRLGEKEGDKLGDADGDSDGLADGDLETLKDGEVCNTLTLTLRHTSTSLVGVNVPSAISLLNSKSLVTGFINFPRYLSIFLS